MYLFQSDSIKTGNRMAGPFSVAPAGAASSARAGSRMGPRQFRYSYLCRLIDDAELSGLAPSLRAELRRTHKKAYWKNLSLLRRDAALILKVRREKMAAHREWNFNALVNDYARIQFLLATLTIAGMSHTTRAAVGLARARAACSEFETLFTSFQPLVATA
ncbi:MAG TPA: hypothetical protein VFC21_06920 [Bryobacteraceae bacterium]|nr:hypothetical protein [Bryobacteraceae bacterium]